MKLQPREDLTEEEIRHHINTAGLGSLLRRLFYKQQSELAHELGLSDDQINGLLHSRLDLTLGIAEGLGKILKQKPEVFIRATREQERC
jgi:plasmid maintenance system antidote protein VapI